MLIKYKPYNIFQQHELRKKLEDLWKGSIISPGLYASLRPNVAQFLNSLENTTLDSGMKSWYECFYMLFNPFYLVFVVFLAYLSLICIVSFSRSKKEEKCQISYF